MLELLTSAVPSGEALTSGTAVLSGLDPTLVTRVGSNLRLHNYFYNYES